jgi:hypothetical protein
VPAAGVPESKPPLLKVTPVGSEPEVTLKVGAGLPVPVTLNEPALPTVNVVALLDVIAGASLTVSVSETLAAEPTPLFALIVNG